jgi:transporter family-2 protein
LGALSVRLMALGAFFGLLIVINGAWAVRYLGVLLLSLLSVAGQLSGAVLADLIVPASSIPLTLNLLAGAGLALLAGVIASTRRRGELSAWARVPPS